MLQSTTEFLRNSEYQTSFNRYECSIAYHSTAGHLKGIWGPKDIPQISNYLMGRSELLASKMIWMGVDVAASDPTAVALVENWRLYPSTYILCGSREIERKKSTRLLPLKLPLLMIISLCSPQIRKQFYVSSIHPGSKKFALGLSSNLHCPTSSGSTSRGPWMCCNKL